MACQFWAELPDAAAAQKYRVFLNNYASGSSRIGRFDGRAYATARCHELAQLSARVPSEVNILLLVSFGFLSCVC